MLQRNRDDRTDNEKYDELIYAVSEITDDQGGNHLLPLGLVIKRTGKVADQNGDGQCHQEHQEQAGAAGKHGGIGRNGFRIRQIHAALQQRAQVPVTHGNHCQLSGDSAYNDTEVQSQTGHNRDDQGQNQECIPVEPVGQLGKEPVHGDVSCHQQTCDDKDPENQCNDIIEQPFLQIKRRFLRRCICNLTH